MKAYNTMIISVIIGLMIGCSEDDNNYYEKNYPTQYCLINENTQNELAKFLPVDNFSNLVIDSFGFITYDIELSFFNSSFFTGTLNNKDSVLQIAKAFLLDNAELTGVGDTSLLQLKLISGSWRFGNILEQKNDDDINYWYIRFNNQEYKDYEVLGTELSVYICTKGVFKIFGNWFPEFYIPMNEFFSYSEAKKTLIGKTFSYSDWGGGQTITISDESFYDEDLAEKVFCPIRNGNCLELHFCWKIPSKTIWNFYVDVITGNLIYKEQTIIF